VPACVSNRKRAELLALPWLTTKAAVFEFATVPVGPPGTLTVKAFFAPTPVYSVDVFVLLFDVHHGDVALALRPHPFTSDESASGALTAEPSEISGYTLYATSERDAFAPATPTLRPTTSIARPTMRPYTPLGMVPSLLG
jgi:hypothetical protein